MLFRTFAFLMLLMAAGSAGSAQVPAPHEGNTIHYMSHAVSFNVEHGLFSTELLQKVRSVLSLSEAQVNALQALLNMKQRAHEQIMQSVEETHRKLEDLVKQPNPNPTEVGSAFLATRNIHERMQAAEEKFRTDFRAMLTADQRATVDKLKNASEQINALEGIGILDGGFPHDFTMPMPGMAGVEPFAIGIHRERSNDH